MNRRRRITAVLAAATLAGGGVTLTACVDEYRCPQGQVAEYDDDGYECEPDADGNGVDDEEDD